MQRFNSGSALELIYLDTVLFIIGAGLALLGLRARSTAPMPIDPL